MMKIAKTSILLLTFSLTATGCGLLNTWQFPIELGQSREDVRSTLGTSDNDPNSSVEWYTDEGFSLTYDEFDRVTLISIAGNYRYDDWNLYDGAIVNGVRTDMNLEQLKSKLGEPDSSELDFFDENIKSYKWKKRGYTIEAEIWVEDYEDAGVVYSGESLKWLWIEKSL